MRAPLARGLTKLDRSVFSKTVILAAASVKENKNISKYRNLFGSKKALFEFRGVSPIRDDPSPSASKGAKCLLLSQGIKLDGRVVASQSFLATKLTAIKQFRTHGENLSMRVFSPRSWM